MSFATEFSQPPRVIRPDIDPVEIYAAGIGTSDYVARVAPLVRRTAPPIGDLLDVGAGGGQLGGALRDPGRRWTAIEPNPNMRARLARLDRAPDLQPCGWETADMPHGGYDTVLAANISGPLEQPRECLARCRAWARRSIVWVVAAQNGPRGLVLAGCLPTAWHGEDETPGVDITLRGLPPSAQPHTIAMVEWTFTAIVSDLDEIATYLADRLQWEAHDGRRPELAAHLAHQGVREGNGIRLEIPRKSAILFWGHPWGDTFDT